MKPIGKSGGGKHTCYGWAVGIAPFPIRVFTNQNGWAAATMNTILQLPLELIRVDTNQGGKKSGAGTLTGQKDTYQDGDTESPAL